MKASHVAFGRMLFGAAFMLPFIALTGNMSMPASPANYYWILLTSAFLVAYVTLWYGALKRTAVSVATAALALSAPITAALSFASGAALPAQEMIGAALIALGVLMLASSLLQLEKVVVKLRGLMKHERHAIGADVRAHGK